MRNIVENVKGALPVAIAANHQKKHCKAEKRNINETKE